MMSGNVSGYYLRSVPRTWLGSDPFPPGTPWPAPYLAVQSAVPGYYEIVFEATLPMTRIRVTARRCAEVRFDFTDWPGRAEPSDGDFDELVDIAKQRTQTMNAHLLCLNTALVEAKEAPLNVSRLTHLDVMHFGEQSIGSGGNPDAMVPFGTASTTDLYRYGFIPVERLRESCDLLDRLLSHSDETILTQLDLLHLALDAARAHDYALALTHAWTVCEAILNYHWRAYLSTKRIAIIDGEEVPFVTNKRHQVLIDSVHFTAMVKTEVLDLVGAIKHEFYDGLMRARADRNRWLHELTSPNRNDVVSAVQTAGGLFTHTFGVEIALPLHFSVSG